MKNRMSDEVQPHANPASAARPLLETLTTQLPKIVPLGAALLLATEAILAAVLIFSRMTAAQQFLGALVIVALPVGAVGLMYYHLSRMAATAESHYGHSGMGNGRPGIGISNRRLKKRSIESDTGLRSDGLESARDELAVIVDQLEEMSARARRLPFGIIGLNDQQFTYALVKLRATANSFMPVRPQDGTPDLLPILAALPIYPTVESPQSILKNAETPASNPEPESSAPPPDQAVIHSVNSARRALREGSPALAIEELMAILEENSEDAEAAELLGIAYEKSGDVDSALESMRVAVLIEPARSSTHYNYAVLLAKADRLLDAYRQNEVALRLNPQYTSAQDLQMKLQNRITAEQDAAVHSRVHTADVAASA